MQQYCHTLLQMVPVKRCYFVKRSLWQALPGWLFLIIKDEISTTPKTLQNTYTTAMTQNNLYTILGDLKQDVEVDTTGILPLFFSLFNSGKVHFSMNLFFLYYLQFM